MDDSRIVLVRDPYRIVAVTDARDDDRILGYAVLTATGARLHYGLTLDDAKARMDDLIGQESRRREIEPVARTPAPRLR